MVHPRDIAGERKKKKKSVTYGVDPPRPSLPYTDYKRLDQSLSRQISGLTSDASATEAGVRVRVSVGAWIFWFQFEAFSGARRRGFLRVHLSPFILHRLMVSASKRFKITCDVSSVEMNS